MSSSNPTSLYFEIVPGARCLLYKPPGLYVEAPLYHKGGRMFVKYGSGFLAVKTSGSTSHHGVKWVEMDCPLLERHMFDFHLKEVNNVGTTPIHHYMGDD